MSYLAISVSFKGNYRERNYAEMFRILTNTLLIMRMHLYGKELLTSPIFRKCCNASLVRREQNGLKIFNLKYNIDKNITTADARFIKFAENLLTGHIGTASAKILISSVIKEDKISLTEVLKILEESKENIIINKKTNRYFE
jgi:hypothetical protein